MDVGVPIPLHTSSRSVAGGFGEINRTPISLVTLFYFVAISTFYVLFRDVKARA